MPSAMELEVEQPEGGDCDNADEDEEEEEPRVVLIPVDYSSRMDISLPWFMANLNKPTDKIVVAHVFDTREHDLADKIYDRIDYLCETMGIASRVTFIERQSAGTGQTLVDIAEDVGATLILMASRGLGAAGRFILGSVSDYMVKHARRPVIVIPPGAAPPRMVYATPQSARTSTSTLV